MNSYILETEKLNYFNLKERAGRKPTAQSPPGGEKQASWLTCRSVRWADFCKKQTKQF